MLTRTQIHCAVLLCVVHMTSENGDRRVSLRAIEEGSFRFLAEGGVEISCQVCTTSGDSQVAVCVCVCVDMYSTCITRVHPRTPVAKQYFYSRT